MAEKPPNTPVRDYSQMTSLELLARLKELNARWLKAEMLESHGLLPDTEKVRANLVEISKEAESIWTFMSENPKHKDCLRETGFLSLSVNELHEIL